MLVLLDTHAFLWWIADSGRLSGSARDVIADELNDIVVSAASAWEIATKFRIGKLPGCEAMAVDVAGHIRPEAVEDVVIAREFPSACPEGEDPDGFFDPLGGPHRDPFDRMLAGSGPGTRIPPRLGRPGIRRFRCESAVVKGASFPV